MGGNAATVDWASPFCVQGHCCWHPLYGLQHAHTQCICSIVGINTWLGSLHLQLFVSHMIGSLLVVNYSYCLNAISVLHCLCCASWFPFAQSNHNNFYWLRFSAYSVRGWGLQSLERDRQTDRERERERETLRRVFISMQVIQEVQQLWH
jgi:hypothetical protein